MSLGKICKTKEFAIGSGSTISVISILMFVVILPAMDESNAIDARQDLELKQLAIQVAQDNVPELKGFISKEFDQISAENAKNKDLILNNYKILCKISQGGC